MSSSGRSDPTPAAHVPVLLERVLELFAPSVGESAVVVDATLGLGGHTEALLRRFPELRVLAIDRDPDAVAASRQRLAPFAERVTVVRAVYDALADAISSAGLDRVQGVLFDLGVSSMQLDRTDRGFAYAHDAPLDMRMDPTSGPSAAEVLNTYPAGDLARVLRVHGDERFARRIADAVVRARADQPFSSSARLVDLLRQTIPAPALRHGGHPAKRTFQALRIEVNDERAAYERALPAALDAVAVGGRVVVLAYHSGEDRFTKQTFAQATTTDLPPGLPFEPDGSEPPFRLLTRGAERATATEIEDNPRAAPARLRAVERVAA